MQLTINLEAPGRSSIDVLLAVQELLGTADAKVRCNDVAYNGPDGVVQTRTFIVLVPQVPAPTGRSLRQIMADLAEEFEQDCVAYKFRDYGTVVCQLDGPHADKWLPFNNEFFVEY